MWQNWDFCPRPLLFFSTTLQCYSNINFTFDKIVSHQMCAACSWGLVWETICLWCLLVEVFIGIQCDRKGEWWNACREQTGGRIVGEKSCQHMICNSIGGELHIVSRILASEGLLRGSAGQIKHLSELLSLQFFLNPCQKWPTVESRGSVHWIPVGRQHHLYKSGTDL